MYYMCDIIGLSCNEEDRLTRSLPLFGELFSRGHPDGWGIAYFDGSRARVKRAPGVAVENSLFFDTIKKARSKNIISHLRSGTGGNRCEVNCHPFARPYNGRDWIFAHNGWVNNVERHPDANGDTDSEQIFHQMMDHVVEYAGDGAIRGTYPAVKQAIKRMFNSYGRDIRLNFLMSDGNMHFAFSHYPNKPIYMLRRVKGYGGAILLSTRMFGSWNWERIPKDRLLAVNNGEVLVLSDKI